MYVKYEEIMRELFIVNDSEITSVSTVLSAFTTNISGDVFTFTGGTPIAGDVLYQNGYVHEIINVTGPTLKINTTGVSTLIQNGTAVIIHSDTIKKPIVNAGIKEAMDMIDLNTRQWFEPRSKTIRLEGKNSNVMFFNVPIISISAVRLNNDIVNVSLSNFEIFNGEENRRNPRIKLVSGTRNIYSTGTGSTFRRASYTEFDGVFGFVENDGATPVLIKKATAILTLGYIKQPLASMTSLTGVGAKKREKTDLHETEYFQPDEIRGGSSGGLSGSIEVDRIIRMYRGPIAIGGSIMDLPTVEAVDMSGFQTEY